MANGFYFNGTNIVAQNLIEGTASGNLTSASFDGSELLIYYGGVALTASIPITTGDYTGSFNGTFTGSLQGTATSASYVSLLAGPNVTINYQTNGIAISSSGGGGGGSQNLQTTTTIGNSTTSSVIIGSTNNVASGLTSVAFGSQSLASGQYAIVEGQRTTAGGNYSRATGRLSIATGIGSHAEGGDILGDGTFAGGNYSHAEGGGSNAIGDYSHAEGLLSTALEYASHAEGESTTAAGYASHTGGNYTVSNANYQTVIGTYNDPARSTVADSSDINYKPFIVGCGDVNVGGVEGNGFEVINLANWNGGATIPKATVILPTYGQLNYANDTAAAAGSIPLGGVYHNAGTLRIRII